MQLLVLRLDMGWLQDGAEHTAEGAPPACGAVSGRCHAQPALHDDHRVPAGRLAYRPIQARAQAGLSLKHLALYPLTREMLHENLNPSSYSGRIVIAEEAHSPLHDHPQNVQP